MSCLVPGSWADLVLMQKTLAGHQDNTEGCWVQVSKYAQRHLHEWSLAGTWPLQHSYPPTVLQRTWTRCSYILYMLLPSAAKASGLWRGGGTSLKVQAFKHLKIIVQNCWPYSIPKPAVKHVCRLTSWGLSEVFSSYPHDFWERTVGTCPKGRWNDPNAVHKTIGPVSSEKMLYFFGQQEKLLFPTLTDTALVIINIHFSLCFKSRGHPALLFLCSL